MSIASNGSSKNYIQETNQAAYELQEVQEKTIQEEEYDQMT